MNVRSAFLAALSLATSASAQSPTPFRIEGRLLVPQGCPAAGSIEVVARRGDPRLRLLGTVLSEQRVGSDGRFELALELSDPGFYLVLDARWLDLPPLWIEPLAGEASLGVLLAPALRAVLHGRFGPAGVASDLPRSLAGSWVWAQGSDARAVVEADGTFELLAPASSLAGPLCASPFAFAPLEFDSPAVEDGRACEIELPLLEPASLQGRVVDSEGNGVRGLTLTFWRGAHARRPLLLDPWGGILSAVTDADGVFEADGLPPGDLCLRIEDPRWRAQGLEVRGLEPGELRSDLELVLLRAASLRGQVVDDSGWPVGGARVTAGGREGCGGPMVTTTDADGRYAFDAALPGEYVLCACSEGRAAHSRGVVTLAEGAREQANLVLGRGSELQVQLGEHPAPVRVLVLDALGFVRADQRVWQGELDLSLPPGIYRVVMQDRDGQREERRVVLSGRERRPWILRM
jgi:protocatechuate 3,4-dioxygenase beta subunit